MCAIFRCLILFALSRSNRRARLIQIVSTERYAVFTLFDEVYERCKGKCSAVKPLYTDSRYNDRIRYNDN